MNISESGLKRLSREWESTAKEPLKIEQIGAAVYGFGTEIACLRLYRYYRYSPDKIRADYSENLKSWYFRLDI